MSENFAFWQMPATTSFCAANQVASAHANASALNVASAALASADIFDLKRLATSFTWLGRYNGATSGGGVMCIPLRRAPTQCDKLTANWTVERPVSCPST